MSIDDRAWWKEAVVYQIYPRSFNDSDGDGIGDIPGILEKVDYIDALGVDCVWLNPVYESPQADNGYDIADYRAINPEYGTMDDWKRLLTALHDRDIRLIMDLVVNHTSEEHAWFQRSRAGDEEYADYYLWRGPGADGHGDGTDDASTAGTADDQDALPNNWESMFGGPAWRYDEERGEYYLHLFAEEQPDLNWEHPDVRESVYDVVSWWLEQGIDGFRMDVINLISKTPGLPDGEPGGDLPTGAEHFVNGPRMHEYFDELAERGFGDRAEEILSVGECVGITPEEAIDVTGRKSDAMDMTIFFEHVGIDREDHWHQREWELSELKAIMTEWQDAVEDGAWVSLYLSNHDQARHVSRFGDDEAYRYESATMLATWLHGHRGTPFVYQGEEIGMTNVEFESPADLDDVEAINYWTAAREAGKEFEEIRPRLEALSRDNARTPMQWSDDEHAGFSESEPWFGVADNHERINVAAEREREQSILEYYRELIDLRHRDDVLVYGSFDLVVPDHESIYAIHRSLPDADDLLIVCNVFDGEPTFEAPSDLQIGSAAVVLSNYESPAEDPTAVDLRPYEAIVYRLG